MQEGLRTPPGALGCLGGQSREEPTGVGSSSPCPRGRSPHAKLDKLYFHLSNSERSCLAIRPALPVHAFPLWHLAIQGTSLLLPRPPSWALGPVEQDRAPSPSLQDPVPACVVYLSLDSGTTCPPVSSVCSVRRREVRSQSHSCLSCARTLCIILLGTLSSSVYK